MPRNKNNPKTAGRELRTPHEDAQPGSDVRAPTVPNTDNTPEGLRRERKPPIEGGTPRSKQKAQ
jgi:hypothetical protein